MKRLTIGWVSILIMIMLVSTQGLVYGQEEMERKVEVKKKKSEEGTSIQVRVEKEDGSVFEKTYASEEEMKNDPELKDLNVAIGHSEGVILRKHDGTDGNIELIIEGEDGEKHKKVIMLKSEEGGEFESKDLENVWIEKLHEEGEEGKEHNFIMKSSDGATYKIQKDENGELQIEKNGELVEIDELEGDEKVEVKEDGTIIISDGDKITEIKMDGDSEAMFFTDDGEAHKIHKIGDGQKMMILKSEDGEEVKINITEDFEWEGEEGNVFILKKEDGEVIEMEDGNFTMKVQVETDVDEDGSQTITVHNTVQKIHIEIIDTELEEISEIPGIHLNAAGVLELEEVDYYPNPNEGQFTLRFRANKIPTEVKIIDLMGKEVYKENIPEFGGMYDKQIDLAGNEPGMYVLQVIQNNRSWSKKVVVE
jgi:hypothetical protein